MNFAPYQDVNPETERALSPPPRDRTTTSPRPRSPPIRKPQANPWGPVRDQFPTSTDSENNAGYQSHQRQGGFGNNVGADERDMDVFATSLPMRMDYEACLAYLLLPPAGGVFLLLFEHKSDYVRFHAWQSSLLFTFLFVFHLIFSFSKVVSFMMLVVDLGLIGWLTLHAYRDADTLDRAQVPFFGRLANSFVDDE